MQTDDTTALLDMGEDHAAIGMLSVIRRQRHASVCFHLAESTSDTTS